MKEILRNGFTTEDYVKAWKSGKSFLQKKAETGAGSIYFMQNIEGDMVIGREYSSFAFTECKYDPRTEMLSVGVELELTQKAKISVSTELIDLEKGEVYAVLGEEECADSSSLNYHKEVYLSEGAPVVSVDLALVAVANWQVGSETGNTVSIIKELRGYQFEYEHKYPKKETGGYIEFKDGSQIAAAAGSEISPGNMDPDVRGEEETINIALFRKPDDVKDLDYLCSFGKGAHGYPHFTVPAAGELTIKNLAGNKEIKKATANCFIKEKENTGGYYLVASSESLSQKIAMDIIDDGAGVVYEYTDPWDFDFMYLGSWQKYYFEYILQITLTIGANDADEEETLMLYVASEGAAPSSIRTVPCIMIMWGCVAENTRIKVKMNDKSMEKKIQEITAGDVVDLGTGTATVKEKWSGPSEKCIVIKAGGRSLKMSKDHPVMTKEGWKRAEKLKETDEIMDEAKSFVRIDSMEVDAGEIQTYNLEYMPGDHPLIAQEEYMIAEGFVVGNMKAQNNHGI